MRVCLLFIALCCSLPGKSDHLEHAGLKRKYFVHLPPGWQQKKSIPLVFILHGGGGRASRTARFTGFNKYADRDTFIAVYPQGYKHHWNDGRITKSSKAHILQVDDIGFIKQLLEKMKKDYPVDVRRIYAAGPSNGGMMCFRLACELSGDFAAIAPVAASMPEDIVYSCRPQSAVSVMMINGTNDPLMPFEGGDVHFYRKNRGKVISTEKTAIFWSSVNACNIRTHKVIPRLDQKDNCSLTLDASINPASGAEVALYTIVGGGHGWPGGSQYLPKFMIGKISRQLNATESICDFFRRHRKI